MTERNLDLHEGIDLSHSPDRIICVVGIDPGVSTGVSVIAFPQSDIPLPDEVPYWGSTQISYGGSGNAGDVIFSDTPEAYVCQQIWEIIRDCALSTSNVKVFVAIEDFIVRQLNAQRDFLAPVRITAGIEQMIYAFKGELDISIVKQSPSDAKSVCTDERMDRWGFSIRTKRDRHSRDADRHATLFLRKLAEKPRLYLPSER